MGQSAAEAVEATPFYLPETWPRLSLPGLNALISGEIERQWPPFVEQWYGDRYREFASDPDWLARSFLANADKEAEGARKLWKITGAGRAFPFANAVAVHAQDEARHARIYVAMLELAFPAALSPTDAGNIVSTYPVYIDEKPSSWCCQSNGNLSLVGRRYPYPAMA